MLPAKREKRPLVPRVTGALQTVAEIVVPTAFVGAGYLVVGAHWVAFKVALASWGIAPGHTALLAPLVAVLAALGIRHVIRLASSRDGSVGDAENE
jgi:hypothetical protein